MHSIHIHSTQEKFDELLIHRKTLTVNYEWLQRYGDSVDYMKMLYLTIVSNSQLTQIKIVGNRDPISVATLKKIVKKIPVVTLNDFRMVQFTFKSQKTVQKTAACLHYFPTLKSVKDVPISSENISNQFTLTLVEKCHFVMLLNYFLDEIDFHYTTNEEAFSLIRTANFLGISSLDEIKKTLFQKALKVFNLRKNAFCLNKEKVYQQYLHDLLQWYEFNQSSECFYSDYINNEILKILSKIYNEFFFHTNYCRSRFFKPNVIKLSDFIKIVKLYSINQFTVSYLSLKNALFLTHFSLKSITISLHQKNTLRCLGLLEDLEEIILDYWNDTESTALELYHSCKDLKKLTKIKCSSRETFNELKRVWKENPPEIELGIY